MTASAEPARGSGEAIETSGDDKLLGFGAPAGPTDHRDGSTSSDKRMERASEYAEGLSERGAPGAIATDSSKIKLSWVASCDSSACGSSELIV